MKAHGLLRDWASRLDAEFGVPRSVDLISRELGVDLVLGPLTELMMFDGCEPTRSVREAVARAQPKFGLFIAGSKPAIYLANSKASNVDQLTSRERFTWAHEIAHFLLWKSTGQATGGDYWGFEAECNWFAGEFLVPHRILDEIAGRPSKAWLGQVRTVQERCKVSWDVAAGCMTAYSKGRIIFLKGRLFKPSNKPWRIEIFASSTAHYCGHAYGLRAVIDEFLFIERCRAWESEKPLISKLTKNIGQIPTVGSYALVWKRGDLIDLMIRIDSLPERKDLELR